jgi:hypothetical protein
MDFQFDARIALLKPPPKHRETIETVVTHEPYAQCASESIAIVDGRQRFVPESENLARIVIEPLTRWSEATGAADCTVEEWHTQFAFELANPNTHGGLRAENALGGAQKAVFFGNGDKHFELHEFHFGLSLFRTVHKQRGRHLVSIAAPGPAKFSLGSPLSGLPHDNNSLRYDRNDADG